MAADSVGEATSEENQQPRELAVEENQAGLPRKEERQVSEV